MRDIDGCKVEGKEFVELECDLPSILHSIFSSTLLHVGSIPLDFTPV